MSGGTSVGWLTGGELGRIEFSTFFVASTIDGHQSTVGDGMSVVVVVTSGSVGVGRFG